MPLDGLTWKELDRNYAVNLLTTYKWNVSLAAKAAGMSVIGFTSTFTREDLCGADAVVDSLADTGALIELVRSLHRQ